MYSDEKLLSIVIPCYNEENNILALVNKVLESPVKNKEIIVVDDCSKDGTRKVLEDQVKPLVSKVIYHDVNGGREPPCGPDFRRRPAMSSLSRMPTWSMTPWSTPVL